MPMENEADARDELGGVLALSACLDIAAAEGLLTRLRTALHDGAVRLDGSQVERVSTPCMQVLAAAATAARQTGVPFQVVSASPALCSAVADLGLTDAIPLEM